MLASSKKLLSEGTFQWVGVFTALSTAIIFAVLLRRHYYQDLNYTFVIATAILHGQLGVATAPSWLNELVPVGPVYYSVFPLGAVLSVMPFSFMTDIGWFGTYPVNLVVALIAAGCAGLSYAVTGIRPALPVSRRLMLAVWLVFGTWFLTNLLFAGAWQIALGFAVLGQLGALYFSLIKPRPLLAGILFAVAFGNRTETVLTAPVILLFLLRPYWNKSTGWQKVVRRRWFEILTFCAVPALLAVWTLAYNHARFGSVFDFGYAHIPGVLKEPWYAHGIFSVYAIPGNIYAMLLQSWRVIGHWPYLLPDGFGGSILLASPFLLLLLRRPQGDRLRYWSAVYAVVALTLALWLHGNAGGWQFSYRYAMVLLPWFLMLFIECLPESVSVWQWLIWGLSLAINAFATYMFMWTSLVH
jgi:hypothetical protein